ncbi:MAG: hypothetical protein M3Y32_09280, partial [Pseudomonadota bacterium]|nr:hypothetical protein [Pseudomonadota bacterium]
TQALHRQRVVDLGRGGIVDREINLVLQFGAALWGGDDQSDEYAQPERSFTAPSTGCGFRW